MGTETVDRMPGVLFTGVNKLTDSYAQGGFCDVEKEEEGRNSKGIKVILKSPLTRHQIFFGSRKPWVLPKSSSLCSSAHKPVRSSRPNG